LKESDDFPVPNLKGYSALRRGRFSASGYIYFLTICTADRSNTLTGKEVGAAVQDEILGMSSENVWCWFKDHLSDDLPEPTWLL